MSRVPPYMKPAKVQHLLEQYGTITNMHLAEEDAHYVEEGERLVEIVRRTMSRLDRMKTNLWPKV